jgi:hypothetical protein
MELADVSGALGSNWKRVDYDVNGEWGYFLILDEFLKSKADSMQAAEGWGGDRFAVYNEPKSGGVCLTQLSAWDSEKDAQEFFNAYGKRTTARYGELSPATGGGIEEGSQWSNWQTSEGKVMIERRGSRVLIVEGVPDKTDTKSLMLKLWR